MELARPNYNIVAKGVEGKAMAGYVLEFSYSGGAHTNSLPWPGLMAASNYTKMP